MQRKMITKNEMIWGRIRFAAPKIITKGAKISRKLANKWRNRSASKA
jgi:hypothetical protein